MFPAVSSRRSFLKVTAGAAVPLIGTTLAEAFYQPTRVAALKGSAKSGVRVAVYPYGGMQHQEIELDG